MKTLYVVRHAKSSWDEPELDDFDRPLNERGKKDAPRMGKRLKEREIHVDLMLSSPAKRAFSTAKKIAEVLNHNVESIQTDRKLYHANPDTISLLIQKVSDKHDSLMIFGHNPGLTEFVNEIGIDVSIDNIPTCGMAAFRFKINSWKDFGKLNGELLFFDYPKSKKD